MHLAVRLVSPMDVFHAIHWFGLIEENFNLLETVCCAIQYGELRGHPGMEIMSTMKQKPFDSVSAGLAIVEKVELLQMKIPLQKVAAWGAEAEWGGRL